MIWKKKYNRKVYQTYLVHDMNQQGPQKCRRFTTSCLGYTYDVTTI